VSVEELLTALATGLKIDRAAAVTVVDSLADRALVTTAGGVVELAPSSIMIFDRVTAGIGHIVEVVYAGIPETDQEITRRVLGLVKERADAELARA
jgi:DNA-binding MarR family transcriptional regulator